MVKVGAGGVEITSWGVSTQNIVHTVLSEWTCLSEAYAITFFGLVSENFLKRVGGIHLLFHF
jgi:hypothetical protein